MESLLRPKGGMQSDRTAVVSSRLRPTSRHGLRPAPTTIGRRLSMRRCPCSRMLNSAGAASRAKPFRTRSVRCLRSKQWLLTGRADDVVRQPSSRCRHVRVTDTSLAATASERKAQAHLRCPAALLCAATPSGWACPEAAIFLVPGQQGFRLRRRRHADLKPTPPPCNGGAQDPGGSWSRPRRSAPRLPFRVKERTRSRGRALRAGWRCGERRR